MWDVFNESYISPSSRKPFSKRKAQCNYVVWICEQAVLGCKENPAKLIGSVTNSFSSLQLNQSFPSDRGCEEGLNLFWLMERASLQYCSIKQEEALSARILMGETSTVYISI